MEGNSSIILKLAHTNAPQESQEGVLINKIVSSLTPLSLLYLVKNAQNKINPRTATVNQITRSIQSTLSETPELYWYKTKGILIATQSCEILDRNRVRLSFESDKFEGIMDGGHNTFAVARYIVGKLYGESKLFKKWEECKEFFDNNFDDIISKYKEATEDDPSAFKFSIPVEIIFPKFSADNALDEYYDVIDDICSARNNNIQLTNASKSNQVGCYDYLKEQLSDFDVCWRSGEPGKIKAEDVVSFAVIPLIKLLAMNKLPEGVGTLSKVSVYSSKGKCVDFFSNVVKNENISTQENGKYILNSGLVKSALDMCPDILTFIDTLYVKFPDMYHKARPGKFGAISKVVKKESPVPFGTTSTKCDYDYPYGFIYPIICGITELMRYDEDTDTLEWIKNPASSSFNLLDLDLSRVIDTLKILHYNPQEVGKESLMYSLAEDPFKQYTMNVIHQSLF